MQKGSLEFLTLVRGALKTLPQNFPVKIELTCVISMELTRNFHGKRGALNFLRPEGEGAKNWDNFFSSGPPLQVFLNGPLSARV